MLRESVDLLIGFVAFSRDEHNVAGRGQGDRALNGLATIGNYLKRFLLKSGLHVGEDGEWILASRIIGSGDAKVAVLFRGSRHERPLGAIAITTAAEHGDQARRFQVAQRAQDIGQRIG
jgi:hypothetical protein